jgi:hypothetical protein
LRLERILLGIHSVSKVAALGKSVARGYAPKPKSEQRIKDPGSGKGISFT